MDTQAAKEEKKRNTRANGEKKKNVKIMDSQAEFASRIMQLVGLFQKFVLSHF
jgi:hypothetical protein